MARKTRRKNPPRKAPAKKAPAKKARTRTTKAKSKKMTKAELERRRGVVTRGKQIAQGVSTTIRNARKQRVTYKKYKGGGAAIILRAGNPANQPKAVASFVVGSLAGIGVSVMLDRWLATRASSQTGDKVQYGQPAATMIHAKSDGIRIFAQLAVGGLGAAGVYAARKKMPILAVGLAGFAGVHLVHAGFMIMTDHVLPMLFKSKKAGDAGDRYFPDRQPAAGSGQGGRPRLGGKGGTRLPFGSKPAHIGPMATGSVGACPSCSRKGLLEPCNNCGSKSGCGCNPFPKTPKQACHRKVSGQSSMGCGTVCPNGDKEIRVPNGNGGGRRVPDDGNGGGREIPGGGGGREVPGDGNGGREVPGGGSRMPKPGDLPGGGGRDRQPGDDRDRQPEDGRDRQPRPQTPTTPQVTRDRGVKQMASNNPYVVINRGPTGMWG